jgi:hypothetical protein
MSKDPGLPIRPPKPTPGEMRGPSAAQQRDRAIAEMCQAITSLIKYGEQEFRKDRENEQ